MSSFTVGVVLISKNAREKEATEALEDDAMENDLWLIALGVPPCSLVDISSRGIVRTNRHTTTLYSYLEHVN